MATGGRLLARAPRRLRQNPQRRKGRAGCAGRPAGELLHHWRTRRRGRLARSSIGGTSDSACYQNERGNPLDENKRFRWVCRAPSTGPPDGRMRPPEHIGWLLASSIEPRPGPALTVELPVGTEETLPIEVNHVSRVIGAPYLGLPRNHSEILPHLGTVGKA